MWERKTCYGSKFERVCCPEVNTGLFAAMLERGDVMGTFAGHDHINDYWGSCTASVFVTAELPVMVHMAGKACSVVRGLFACMKDSGSSTLGLR